MMNGKLIYIFCIVAFCLGDCSAQKELSDCEINNLVIQAFDPQAVLESCFDTSTVEDDPIPTTSSPPPTTSQTPSTPSSVTTCPSSTSDVTADTTDDTDNCTCVTYHLCADNFGEGIMTIKGDPGPCHHYLDVCCNNVTTTTTKSNTTDPTTPETTTDIWTNPTSPGTINEPWACGMRNPEGTGIKIFGEEAQYGEFPWMVAVLRVDERKPEDHKKKMECGGSIVDPLVILTAAHCVKGKQNLLIRAGEWDSQTEKELYPTQERKVKKVIIHEGYYGGALFNDIALLVLEAPLESSPVVSTICLPEQGEDMDKRHCVSSGWGKDAFGQEGRYQTILKKVELDTVPRDTCQAELRKTRLGSNFKLHQSFICAGGIPGIDTCKGDGGGPLACPSKKNPNVYVQAGIVAWGIDCGKGTPAAYTNVPLFRDWMDKVILEATS